MALERQSLHRLFISVCKIETCLRGVLELNEKSLTTFPRVKDV